MAARLRQAGVETEHIDGLDDARLAVEQNLSPRERVARFAALAPGEGFPQPVIFPVMGH